MVAVRHSDADRYIANLPNDALVYLVFGPDAGLVSERTAAIISGSVDDRHDPFQVVELAGDQVSDDPGVLLDEVNTIGLFQTRRVIHITAGRKSFVDAVKSVLEAEREGSVVVVSSGPLRGDAPLRSLCSKAKLAASIECYPDNDRDISRIIDEELSSKHIRISSDAKTALVTQLGADRLGTRSEIEKLIVYTHGKSEISLNDVVNIVAGAAGEVYEDAMDAAFLGDRNRATETFLHVFDTGENINSLIGSCIRRCLLLHSMLVEIERGSSIDQAMQKFGQNRLPFPKRKNIEAQIKNHTQVRLLDLLEKLNAFGFLIRDQTRLSETIAIRMLWTITQACRRNRDRS